MALWGTRTLTPEQKAQIAAEQQQDQEGTRKSHHLTDSGSLKDVEEARCPMFILLNCLLLAIADVAQTRSILQTLGPRPDHETVDTARLKLSEIESNLSTQLEEIVLSPQPAEVDRLEWRAHLADKEQHCRQASEKEKNLYKTILQLEEMHESYEKLLKAAEQRLVKIYEKAEMGGGEG
ncbi:hypothetical protein GH714_023136 [Hevea brasiliensis]|uniref:Uncharacterized protein n=1 Tax=Hevea brasiliensis TaxID=3981 RepID=A0A6A6MCG4_HEVBR|nr:hypothetical protein GH714_023136 [Hevea brasiliensis]